MDATSFSQTPGELAPVSLDGFTLHYGLILLTVLVLAAVGVEVLPRIAWLAGLLATTFALHIVGVTLLARGIAWASEGGGAADSGTFVYSSFAVF